MADPLARLARATRARERAQAAWTQAIRDAHAEGCSLRQIAAAARVTNPRVHQILRGR